MKPLLVTAALIQSHDGKILIAKRRADSQVEANKWEFPGGKLEFGETPQACLQREIKEELGLEVEVGELFGVNSHVYNDSLHIVLLAYWCQAKDPGEAKALQVGDFKWIDRKDVNKFEFAAADIPFIEKL